MSFIGPQIADLDMIHDPRSIDPLILPTGQLLSSAEARVTNSNNYPISRRELVRDSGSKGNK